MQCGAGALFSRGSSVTLQEGFVLTHGFTAPLDSPDRHLGLGRRGPRTASAPTSPTIRNATAALFVSVSVRSGDLLLHPFSIRKPCLHPLAILFTPKGTENALGLVWGCESLWAAVPSTIMACMLICLSAIQGKHVFKFKEIRQKSLSHVWPFQKMTEYCCMAI
ncbi:hypothetical protein EVAR_101141_1 [Eumeta japonica]|uniref:Uncharacterized protein n=1 Tax=Eumeta variegata TaxID=151549 RepID=A0A4C2ADT5_EUMVA|nr:hypothetical protein EVAR_101141_1 [Eumeta japonica]